VAKEEMKEVRRVAAASDGGAATRAGGKMKEIARAQSEIPKGGDRKTSPRGDGATPDVMAGKQAAMGADRGDPLKGAVGELRRQHPKDGGDERTHIRHEPLHGLRR